MITVIDVCGHTLQLQRAASVHKAEKRDMPQMDLFHTFFELLLPHCRFSPSLPSQQAVPRQELTHHNPTHNKVTWH